MSSYCFLSFIVSDEMSVVNIIEDLLFMISCFSLANSKILFVLSLNSLTMMYLGMHLFEFIVLGVNWASWMCRIMFFIKFGTLGAHYLKYSLCFFSLSFPLGLLFMFVCMLDGVPHISETLFFIHVSFFSSDWIISIDFF